MAAAAVPSPVIKVAALCGSLRKGSYNRGLLRAGIRSSPFFRVNLILLCYISSVVMVICASSHSGDLC